MDKEAIKNYIEEVEHIVEDVNKNEIVSHIALENLGQWLESWQNEIKRFINDIKEEL